MITLLQNLLSAALYGLTGFGLFLLLLNRVLLMRPDSKGKIATMVFFFFFLTGGSTLLGFFLPLNPYAALPLAFMLVAAGGEVRRLIIRRQCAASPPVDTIPHAIRFSRPFTTTDLATHRYAIRLPAWKGRPFRITHLTDLHVNRHIPEDYYRQVLALVEQTRPDLVFVTGDFISNKKALPILPPLLRPIGTYGSFAVLGNHDYWNEPDQIRAMIRASGITLLTNETISLDLDGHRIRISGFDFPWDESEARPPSPGSDGLHLVLTHSPDNIYRLSRPGIHAVFSGHYHAGQGRIPFLGPLIIPSAYGRRFDHGHFLVNGTHLFIPSGIGAATPPLRIYCQPDIFIVDITGQ